MREPVSGSGAAFEKEMTDSGPGYRESEAIEDLSKIGDVLSLSSCSVFGNPRRMVSKSPAQFEIR